MKRGDSFVSLPARTGLQFLAQQSWKPPARTPVLPGPLPVQPRLALKHLATGSLF